jgi:proton-translocating NADH-quinone oxidoreductase chain M
MNVLEGMIRLVSIDVGGVSLVNAEGISLLFVMLVLVLLPSCMLLVVWSYSGVRNMLDVSGLDRNEKQTMMACVLAILGASVVLFSTSSMVWFFVAFEASVVPLFFLVNMTGSSPNRGRASYLLLIFTLVGSITFAVALVVMYLATGTYDMTLVGQSELPVTTERLLYVGFAIPFVVKLPLWPFHLWLPEAHSEASTVGSVILAGLMLKLGSYGLVRISGMMPLASLYYAPTIVTMCLVGSAVLSLVTLRQTDLKRIIAYTSISHMSIVAAGIVVGLAVGTMGAVVVSVAHGISASVMFILVGMLYMRYHTRLVPYYGGLSGPMPVFTIVAYVAALATISFPGSLNFVGELLLVMAIASISKVLAVMFVVVSVVGCASYTLWALARTTMGAPHSYLSGVSDISRMEAWIVFPLLILLFLLGVFPTILFV